MSTYDIKKFHNCGCCGTPMIGIHKPQPYNHHANKVARDDCEACTHLKKKEPADVAA